MLYIIIACVVVIILFIASQRRNNGKGFIDLDSSEYEVIEDLPYKKKEYLLTKAENSFYSVLLLATKGKEIRIFSKVRLADVVYVPKGTEHWQTYWNKIQSKHLDFVVCSEKLNQPIFAIELDDSSHSKEDRKNRDRFVEKALENAGLSLLRFPVQYSYDISAITQKINEVLNKEASK